MENNFKNEVTDLYNQALAIKNNNDLITFCHKARYSCERILQIIYENEIGPMPKSILFSTMLRSLEEKKDLIPLEIRKLFETVSATGNPNSHPNNLPESKRKQQASIAEQSLSHICNWFFNDYLNVPFDEDMFLVRRENLMNSQVKNYRDLLIASLDDKVLELEEFEQIIEARETLQIDSVIASEIEKEIVLEKLGKKISALPEILSPTDLESFKKYDTLNNKRPEWALKAINKLTTDTEHEILRGYFKYYFNEIPDNLFVSAPLLMNLLGCWQGWYFQYESKTYFNLFFVAKNDKEFIGYCIEPVNPDWGYRYTLDEPFLFADIIGEITDEVIFRFNKRMLVSKSWNINYEGVLIEDGQYFDGEWSIQNINGAFNAMKTKSLLPVRIFDTSALKPVVSTQFMDNFRNLTSTWFVQVQGKTSQFGFLHVIDRSSNIDYIPESNSENPDFELFQLFANLIMQEGSNAIIDYLEGNYVEQSKVQIITKQSVLGNYFPKEINFSVDWNTKTISGTLKDNIYKIRSFKGFKI